LSKVLLLTTEPVPIPGSATTGAGLRAWGLAQSLSRAGLNVTIGSCGLDAEASVTTGSGTDCTVRPFARGNMGALLDEVHPDIVVLQHWGLARELTELTVPLAIDLAGPHLLERLYWGSSDPQRDVEEKLAALRRADFVTCSGHYQRHYFYPFLLMAGFDLRTTSVPVIPFSVPPPAKVRHYEPGSEPTFVYGGAFLAWQDPTNAITWLLEEMDAAGKGRLLFYGGTHPVIDASGGKFAGLSRLLKNHPRVEMRGWKSFDELLSEYSREGDVALDLMARNPERELAFTTRTMIYLHCGLPVIYNNYSEVSDIIEEHACGWTLDPADEQGLRTLARRLLNAEIDLQRYREGALAAAAEYDWTRTGQPLVEFCRHPQMRPGRVEFLLAHERKAHDHAADNVTPVPSALARARLRLRPGRLVAPAVYVTAWLIVLYMRVRLRKTVTRS
jgi:hypothetical protein